MPADSSHYMFKHHPETCAPDDHWGQVKRTVGGKPVPPEQIAMILDAIRSGLGLSADDGLLDLCCGNGALTTHLFADCRGGLGVDYSEFLIGVARERFTRRPSERYRLGDALEYVRTETDPEDFTKVLCYGAFPYFGQDAARELLGWSDEARRALEEAQALDVTKQGPVAPDAIETQLAEELTMTLATVIGCGRLS